MVLELLVASKDKAKLTLLTLSLQASVPTRLVSETTLAMETKAQLDNQTHF
jgi:hypothetical protein